MKVGDLVEDEWGEMAIITSQVGVTDRWRLKYILTGIVSTSWESNLSPLRS
jgi:hypothetical protein